MSEFNYKHFEKFIADYENATKEIDKFLKEFLSEMAFRVIAKVKPRTPRITSALINSWQVGEIKALGTNLEIEIVNGMDYASFVEYGARNLNGTWRNGRFMLTISIDEVANQIPLRFDKAWKQFLTDRGIG
jgi:hypothetical protein